MFVTEDIFVGRDRELARAEVAVARVLAGDGALLLFSGEAGLGKTRLAQAVAATAAARGARVVWGRAWEAGGAPSYWPWIQVFRALGLSDDPFASQDTRGALELAQTRFATFDGAARALKRAAAESALAIVLDDVHAADVSSLLFLHFFARELAGSRVLIVATYRDAEARLDGDRRTLLAKLAREGEEVALSRLSYEAVRAWIEAASGESPTSLDDESERVFRASEGNALFVHELLRVRSSLDTSMTLGLRAILDEHLARVTPRTRAILEAGSVLGRELEPELLGAIADCSTDDVAIALREAREAGLLVSLTGGERLSFSHMLVRERLYAELAPSRSGALHTLAAEHLLASGGELAAAAHHLFESASAPAHVARIALAAAQSALGKLGFEDASLLCERALEKHRLNDELTVDLEINLGESRMRAGDIAGGRAACVLAAERAKAIGAVSRQARAALAYATELTTASVDPDMVRLLRDALEALPEDPSALRARVLARYAAALVPPATREEAEDILVRARAAVSMARAIGEPETLVFVLQYGGSAMGYLVTAEERRAVMLELRALAEIRGSRIMGLALGGMWMTTLREHGEAHEADVALTAYEDAIRGFPQAYYQWRLPMLRSTLSALEGAFSTAQQLAAEALAIAEGGEVRGGSVTWALNRMSIAHLAGDPASVRPDADRIIAIAGRLFPARGFMAWLYAAIGQADKAAPLLAEATADDFHFPWALISGETVCLLEDRVTAERLYPALCYHAPRNRLFWGPFGAVCFGSTQRICGDVASLLGRDEEARRWYAEAIAFGAKLRAPALVAIAEKRLALLDDRPASGTTPAARVPVTREAIAVELRREGEIWCITSSTGDAIRLKDSKGLQYLAELVARPGSELHVTQLSELAEVPGDAGVVLDERAKRQYKERVAALREQIDEAHAFNDTSRASRLEAELDAIADQLAAAVGLGGRDRKLGSHTERLRINVQRRLRDAIARIEEQDPALGRYLTATIRTGVFCVFTPI